MLAAVIPTARDTDGGRTVRSWLRAAWFVAAAVALPLSDLLRSSTTASRVGIAVYALLLLGLIAVQIAVIRIGPSSLHYRIGYEELIVETATRPIRIRFERISRIELFDGRALRYRSGLSMANYHVGSFFGPQGAIGVAASRIDGVGLLIEHWGAIGLGRAPRRLFISPADPEATRLMLSDLLAERLERIHLGQP